MLLPLDENTPRFAVFTGLNALLAEFYSQAVTRSQFSERLLPGTLGAACYANDPTRSAFHGAFTEFRLLPRPDRQRFVEQLSDHQSIPDILDGTDNPCPTDFTKDFTESVKQLTKHLYRQTKDLTDVVEAQGGGDINTHFQAFREHNGNVCPVCGTSDLAAERIDLCDEENQWRAAYDHLLCQAHYPFYAVHPDNILPACETCNSKAKGSADILHCLDPQTRRVQFFNPWTESCEQDVILHLAKAANAPGELAIRVSWQCDRGATTEKIETWDRIYQINKRIPKRMCDVAIWMRNQLGPISCSDPSAFAAEIASRAQECDDDIKRGAPWSFWEQRLYAWIEQQGQEIIDAFYAMIQHKQSIDQSAQLFPSLEAS